MRCDIAPNRTDLHDISVGRRALRRQRFLSWRLVKAHLLCCAHRHNRSRAVEGLQVRADLPRRFLFSEETEAQRITGIGAQPTLNGVETTSLEHLETRQ